jgi:Patched family
VQVLPFVLLGIGVDDLFVLVRSIEDISAKDPDRSLEKRFRQALELGGMSITVTSLTNAAAFLFGSITSIPAIQWCARIARMH